MTTVRHRFEDDPRRGFKSSAAFLRAVMAAKNPTDRDDVRDPRLQSLAARPSVADPVGFMLPAAFTPGRIMAAAGSDEHGTYSDPYGGFLVGSELAPGALIRAEADPTAGRTIPVPMGEPSMDLPAFTSGDRSQSVAGGLLMTRRPETVDPGASRAGFELVHLEAATLMGVSFATEELLGRNPAAFVSILAAGYRAQWGSALLREKLLGTGAGEYLGALNAACRITVDKETLQAADTLVGSNVAAMRRRCWGYADALWMAAPDTFEELVAAHLATAAGARFLYHASERDGEPDTLAGRPIYFTEHLPALGNEGDLILVNWGGYLEGTYQPLEGAESVHVRFIEHERCFRFTARNAGAPWWRSAITPANGGDTLSPIVTLQART